MKEITRISETEEMELRERLDKANETDSNIDWQSYMDYMKKLGTKYGFDPTKVAINTKGIVTLLPNETVWVVSNKKTGKPEMVYYAKQGAVDHVLGNPNTMHDLKYDEVEIQ